MDWGVPVLGYPGCVPRVSCVVANWDCTGGEASDEGAWSEELLGER